MYFKILILFIFMPMFLLANPPLKKIKPDPTKVMKAKPMPKKLKPELKPTKPTMPIKPTKPTKPTKQSDETFVKPSKNGAKETTETTSKPKSKSPLTNIRPDDDQKEPKHQPLVKPSQPKEKDPDQTPLVHPRSRDPKNKHKDEPHKKPKPDHHPNRHHATTSQETSSSSGSASSSFRFASLFGDGQPKSALRLAIAKTFGLYGSKKETPLEAINFSIGYRYYFVSFLTELEVNGLPNNKLQFVRALLAFNIPAGHLSFSPLVGVGVVSENLMKTGFPSLDLGLLTEYHLSSSIAFGMRYLFHNLDSGGGFLHSLALSFAYYF